ncbi:hypothetical protein, partial [Variovorax sp. HJSM1_2]|uniref:hypothetical protein n=1 Tax=Variovorax sp. HJSM1_2 TaxID=3366263 RepID=UPI003BDF2CCD
PEWQGPDSVLQSSLLMRPSGALGRLAYRPHRGCGHQSKADKIQRKWVQNKVFCPPAMCWCRSQLEFCNPRIVACWDNPQLIISELTGFRQKFPSSSAHKQHPTPNTQRWPNTFFP